MSYTDDVFNNRPGDPERRIGEGWAFKFDMYDQIVHIGGFMNSLKTNEEAFAFVQRRAAEGSEYHIECLAYAVAQRMLG